MSATTSACACEIRDQMHRTSVEVLTRTLAALAQLDASRAGPAVHGCLEESGAHRGTTMASDDSDGYICDARRPAEHPGRALCQDAVEMGEIWGAGLRVISTESGVYRCTLSSRAHLWTAFEQISSRRRWRRVYQLFRHD